MAGQFVSGRVGLTDADARSLSPAHARVLQSLSGRLRALYEMSTGRPIDDGEQPSIPRNPQGLLGVDFSGPPFGSAWRHPMGGSGGLKPDTSGAGAWEGHQIHGSAVSFARLIIPFTIYVRPHAALDRAPYTRGYPHLRVYLASAGSANFDVTCRWGTAENQSRSDSSSISSTSETIKSPVNTWWDLQPGRNNLTLELSTTSATAVILASWSVYQAVKRSH